MEFSEAIKNLDFLSVGISIAGIVILGAMVFFSNRKSITNRTFLVFSFVAVFWSVSNYLIYQSNSSELTLYVTRLHMFFSTWYSFFIFQLFYVFPQEKKVFPARYKTILLPVVIFTSLLTLTPWVLSKVVNQVQAGEVAIIAPAPGIAVFGVVVVSLIVSGITLLFRKLRKVESRLEKTQYKFILWGAAITFSLHLIFNFLMPIVFTNPRFVPLGAVFTFPFVLFTAYAIFRHHLLNVKVIATEILVFVLAIVTLFEVVLSKDLFVLIFRSGVFILVLSFGILLIRSVLREVEQREELERLNKQIEDKNVQLEDLSRAKTQLLSLASHQVKAPLAAIKGFASLILEGLYGPISDKVKDTVVKMKHSSDELIELINTLLDLRRIEEGKMEYQFAKVKLADLVKDMTTILEPLAKEKKLEFTVELKSDVMVNADAQKLKQVIQNLTENAIKYTPAGFVRVNLSEEGAELVFSVTDSGLGISKDLIPHLFEEFVRDEKVKTKILGTGLGLYVAKKILEAHGGTISVESAGEGKGSKFTVRLKKI